MKPNLVVKSMKVKAIPESSILNWPDSAVLVRINLTPQNASIIMSPRLLPHYGNGLISYLYYYMFATLWCVRDFLHDFL